MSNRTTLKGYFVTNAIPKQSDFADLIDSSFVQTEDSIRKQGSDPVAIQAQQADQNGVQQALHFYKNFNDANAAWKVSLLTPGTANPASGLSIGSSVAAQSSLFIKETDGNVGIGITNPVNKFEVGGDMHTNGNAIYFRVSNVDKMDYIKWNGAQDRLELAGWNGINMGYTGSDGVFKNTLVITSAGNVGIGAEPRSKLDTGTLSKGQLGAVFGRLTEGDNTGEGTFLGVRGYKTQPDNPSVPGDIKSFAIEHSFYGVINSSINFFRGGDTTGGFIAFNTLTNIERVRIDQSGNLYVKGTQVGPSDVRIKQNISQSNGAEDMDTINKLKVKEYFIKKDKGELSLQKGFIAQEVEEVLPEAVVLQSEFIPDIFTQAASAIVNNGALVITMKDEHRFETGDIVRFITPTGNKEESVVVINDKVFSIDNWMGGASDIFVYGKRVDDFRTLNYNAIFTLGISAIQELYKQLQQLREELKVIKEGMPTALAPAI